MSFKPSYWDRPEKTEFTAEVERVEEDRVVLSKTFFHPEGGGQPADKGTLNDFEVKDVQKEDDRIYHYVPNHPFEEGQEVKGEIDEEYRVYCMRAHTGSHVVFGAAREMFGDVNYSGFEIGEDKIRIDFETDEKIGNRELLELERSSNGAILDRLEISTRLVDREELERLNGLAYAKELPDEEEVRLVEIEGWDTATCSGTHLSNTIEVGRISILGKKKLQEGVTRIEFCVDKDSLEEDSKQKRFLGKVTDILDTNYRDLPEKIETLMDRLKETEEEVEILEEELLSQTLENSEPQKMSGFDLRIDKVSTSSSDVLSREVKSRTGPKDLFVIVNDEESLSIVVSVGEDVEDVNAGDIIGEISDEFRGGGGGTESFAQGGGFRGDANEIVGFVEELFDQ